MICMLKVINNCSLMYLETLEICLERNELDLAKVLSAPGLTWEATLKKTAVKLNLLTDINMLLMVEQVIGEGTCHSIY